MPNDMVTAGNRAPQVEFPSSVFARSVTVHNSICLIYPKFNGLLCMVPGYRFWGGPIAFFWFRAHLWQKTSCNSQVVFKHFSPWLKHNMETYQNWLVVSTPLKNISHLGLLFPIYGKIKNTTNHTSRKIIQNQKITDSFREGYLVDHQVVMVEVKLWVAKLQLNMRPKITLDLLDSWLLFASTSKSVINAVESLKTTNLTDSSSHVSILLDQLISSTYFAAMPRLKWSEGFHFPNLTGKPQHTSFDSQRKIADGFNYRKRKLTDSLG